MRTRKTDVELIDELMVGWVPKYMNAWKRVRKLVEARPTVRSKRPVQQAKAKILPSAVNCPGLKNKSLCKSCRVMIC